MRRALAGATAALTDAGIDSPRLCAEMLLAHAMGCDRLRLMADSSLLLPPEQKRLFDDLIRRRLSREPVQHIVGRTEFWSLPILCDRRALIPRPETELLVETALEIVTANAECRTRNGAAARETAPLMIADVGTGTGCVAIAVAHELPQARIIATDISAEALALAEENVRLNSECRVQNTECRTKKSETSGKARWDRALHQPEIINHQLSIINLAPRVVFRRGDLCAPLAEYGPGAFDMILSNPPYIPEAQISSLQPEVRDYDPWLALRGGPEGCTIIIRLLREALAPLRPGGFLVMEIGVGEAEVITHDLSGGWKLLRIVRDGAGIERIIALQKER